MGQSPYPEDSLQRLQAVDLEIAAAVDKICRENDIDYFIDGGTLLGAVRHGGFIPWDDDIDIDYTNSTTEQWEKYFDDCSHRILCDKGKGVCPNCHRLDNIDPLARYCRYCGAKLAQEDGHEVH